MAHREGGPQDEASRSRFFGFLHVLWCGGHFQSLAEALRAKAAFLLLSLPLWETPDSLANGLPACLAGSENLGQALRLERGLPTRHRMLSGDPKWLIVRGVPRTRPQNRDFLGFCRFCGA